MVRRASSPLLPPNLRSGFTKTPDTSSAYTQRPDASLQFQPTFYGFLASKKDALLLIEACIQGILEPSYPTDGSPVQSGSVFVFHTAPDGAIWDASGLKDYLIVKPEFERPGELIKKTLNVLVCGMTVVSYYKPDEVDELSLLTPSEHPVLKGLVLRVELACQDPQSFLEMRIANSSTHDFLKFMLLAFIVCRSMTSGAQIENFLLRTSNNWHPTFPVVTYWQGVCREDLFHGATAGELENQMIYLLSKFLHSSGLETSSRLPDHSQPSQKFSPSQNRRLFCESFGFRVNGMNPFGAANWAKIGGEIPEASIRTIIKPRLVEEQALWHMLVLDLVHDRDGLMLSRPVRQMLEYLSVKEFRTVYQNIKDKISLMSDLGKEENHTPLLLAECISLPNSRTSSVTKSMFQAWVGSPESSRTCSQQVYNLRTSTSGPTLLLSVVTLRWFQEIHLNGRPDELRQSHPVGLKAFDRLVYGDVDIGSAESQVALQDMIWSFSRAAAYHLSGLDYEVSHQMLAPYLHSRFVPLSPDRIGDHYWIIRLVSPSDHKDAMARVRHDFQHTVPEPRSTTEGSKEKPSHYTFR